MSTDPSALVALERYPILDLTATTAIKLLEKCRSDIQRDGMAVLPGFIHEEMLPTMANEAERLSIGSFHQDILGTPYLEKPSADWPPQHPRTAIGRSALTAIPYDVFPGDSALRSLYEWDPLLRFIQAALGLEMLYRYADPLSALNVAAMHDGDELAWHFDQTDFVVSLALQRPVTGGEFICAPLVRSPGRENYELVASCLEEAEGAPIIVIPFEPGSLMLFEGRNSLHRVNKITGPIARHVALLGYDRLPEQHGSQLLKTIRYGRTS